MSSGSLSPTPAEVVSYVFTSSTSKSERDAVDSDGTLSCEEERLWLELSRKRKRALKMSEGPQPFSSDLCHEVGKPSSEEAKLEQMTSACKTILKCIGEDPGREGLLKTPERWAKALLFMTSGYSLSAEKVLNNAVFTEDSHKEIVVVKDISIHSMCEHHMLPFTGRIHVGYIPNGKSKSSSDVFLCFSSLNLTFSGIVFRYHTPILQTIVIGLSKIARIAEVYARRLQVQERLTRQIADAMEEALHPLGVGVVIESSHFCMVMRGVQQVDAKTVTSCVRGCFKANEKTRAEFFNIINGR